MIMLDRIGSFSVILPDGRPLIIDDREAAVLFALINGPQHTQSSMIPKQGLDYYLLREVNCM